jgi:hypothetical protein
MTVYQHPERQAVAARGIVKDVGYSGFRGMLHLRARRPASRARWRGSALQRTQPRPAMAGCRRRIRGPHGFHPPTCPVPLILAWIALMTDRGITGGLLLRAVDRHGGTSEASRFAAAGLRVTEG